jgi:hypothetical protein
MMLRKNYLISHIMQPFRYFLCVISIFVWSFQTGSGQSLSRALNNYQQGDLVKSFEMLSKLEQTEPNNAAVNFGLALIYSNELYSGKDYFEAWQHIMLADSFFTSLSEDNLKTLNEFLSTLEIRKTNRSPKQRFDLYKLEIENKLIKYVREENDLEMIHQFLTQFPHSKFYENVLHIRNYLEYSKVANENSLEAFMGFIKEYPDAAQIPQAIEKRNKLAFEKAKAAGTVPALDAFLKQYPTAIQRFDAIKLRNEFAFNDAKQLNTIEGYDVFVQNYPDAVQVPTALKMQKLLVFEKAKTVNTFEAYADFIRKYPEAEQFVDVYDLKASALGNLIAAEGKFPMQQVAWIKGLDTDGSHDRAAALEVATDGSILVIGSTLNDSTGITEGWFLKLDPSGKMVWSKNYSHNTGASPEASVLSSSGDLYAVGWTVSNPLLADTVGWFIKLNPQGFKYYDKEVESEKIMALSLTAANELFFGGYTKDTSWTSHFWLGLHRESGRKLWSREYSGKGIVTCASMDATGKPLVLTPHWLYKIDRDGYLVWEYFPEVTDSLVLFDVNKNGDIYAAGINAAAQLKLFKISSQGKVLLKSIIPLILPVKSITALKLNSQGELFISGTAGYETFLIKTNDKGQLLSDIRFSAAYPLFIKDFCFSPKGGQVLLLQAEREQTRGDIGVVQLK